MELNNENVRFKGFTDEELDVIWHSLWEEALRICDMLPKITNTKVLEGKKEYKNSIDKLFEELSAEKESRHKIQKTNGKN